MCCSSVPFFTILATGLEEGSRGRLYYVDNDDGGADMIFVKSFTQAYTLIFRNIPEENA